MFRDAVDRIWVLEYSPDVMPLTQMRFDIRYVNERYLIQRSPPAARSDEDEPPRHAVHEGSDPRAYMGVEPALRQALRHFVEREKAG
jgi:hypothetical protein